jgi:hypothetical protein
MKTSTQLQIGRATRKLRRQHIKGRAALAGTVDFPAHHAWETVARWHLTEVRRAEKLAVRRFINTVFEKVAKENCTHEQALRALIP